MRKLSAFCVANLMEERTKKKKNAWDVTRMYFETVLSFFSCNLGLWWTFLFLNLGLLNIQKHPHLNYRTIYCCIQKYQRLCVYIYKSKNYMHFCSICDLVQAGTEQFCQYLSKTGVWEQSQFDNYSRLCAVGQEELCWG